MKTLLRLRVIERLKMLENISDESVKEAILKELTSGEEFKTLSLREKNQLLYRVFAEIRGYGILQELLDDAEISEIMVNGIHDIFIEKRGRLEKTKLEFETEERLDYIIQKMVAEVGRSVNAANPIVDARLESGERINVVLSPISLKGSTLTIRKFQNTKLSMDTLIENKTLTKEAADFLKTMVVARYNIFISGATASGKTTFLNALSSYIDRDERIISIEDSAELELLNHSNWVRLETRNANSLGEGGITTRDLLKNSLRMRPDRIIVGEVRGAEAIDMLQAMNTGHDGSLSTGHANSAEDMLSRIETMVLSSLEIPLIAIKKQINSALDLIIHLNRNKDGRRVVDSISALSELVGGDYHLISLFTRENEADELIRTESPLPRIKKLKDYQRRRDYVHTSDKKGGVEK